MLGKEAPSSEAEFRKIAKYKTFKIVNVLRHVCRVYVMEVKLKWLLSEDDSLVMT